MKLRTFPAALATLTLFAASYIQAQTPARIETFSPQGTVKKVRQVRVRFSEPMVSFGDPRVTENPFDISCGESGTSRWVDDRNWAYDFAQDLPVGLRCEFRVTGGLRSLAGNPIAGQTNFEFSTGGPSIVYSIPYQGSTYVDEDQIFILQLDGEAAEGSILANVSFTVEGIDNNVGIRIVAGQERQEILDSQFPYRRNLPEHLLMIQARQRFPAASKISLIWGKDVTAPTGVANEQDQILPFVVRGPFRATFRCRRENPEAACVPITPMSVNFSAPVLWDDAKKSVLKGPGGKEWLPSGIESDEQEQQQDRHVSSVVFKGPFPEKSPFTVELPVGLKDDAGRPLSNADSFPLSVSTDEYPPLAKFAASFGILELGPNPLLPVTLRNVEPEVAARMLEVEPGAENIDPPRELELNENARIAARLQGRVFKVPAEEANEILFWIKKIERRTWEDRGRSVFGPVTEKRAVGFSIPKLQGPKAFEVVGIPMKGPGFYVVEIESELLGASLLGKPEPMYVPTSVLVTNLSVHFKWGIESSLVWVTSLDKGEPVSGARIAIRDCEGKLLWQGESGRDGIARVEELPWTTEVPRCSYDSLDTGLVITAMAGEDMALVHTSWDDGIEPWRFQLPTQWDNSLTSARTVFGRSLLRAGETVHMKHILRERVMAGFSLFSEGREGSVLIRHLGSGQEYNLPAEWNPNGSAETVWTIPREAKLGGYGVYLSKPEAGVSGMYSGSFRVEAFRVPLMKGVIRPPSRDLIAPSSVPVDLTVTYLGGGAASRLPVKFRHEVQKSAAPRFEEFDNFIFSNGRMRTGLVRREEEQEEADPSFALKSEALTLDASGSARTTITGLPKVEEPLRIMTELDFEDPNGETQTVSTNIPLWPAEWLVGIKPDSWALSREKVKFQVAVVDLQGNPVEKAPVKVDLLLRKTYSHRKRLVGGFYAYEHSTEITSAGVLCEGNTNRQGLLFCEKPVSESGNVILQAVTRDRQGREDAAYRDVWVAGSGAWWFRVEDSDRIDVIPETRSYEPGQKAKLQVRMPFRKATALITVEREGVGQAFVKELSGNEPVIELPVEADWSPNVFISVLLVRGRVGEMQPTATVDLGRPAFKLGITEINVGRQAHELKVKVTTDRTVYKVREKARVRISAVTADGKLPPAGSEVALAAVDEGLLELMPNTSWNLLDAMMGERGYGVRTSTAQMNVIGKRHFGLKALPEGGGGGSQVTRELFDTLLLWKGRVILDEKGEASVDVPLNDSITSFRIAAVGTGGAGLFGTGSTSIRSTQDLTIFSGIAPVVREGDTFRSVFTLRNATDQPMDVRVTARVRPLGRSLEPAGVSLAPGESKEIGWTITAPTGVGSLDYEVVAEAGGTSDRLAMSQKVVPAVPVRAFQATISQLDGDYTKEVERPADAAPDRGGVKVSIRPSLLAGLDGVADYMNRYPYACLEQVVSKAVALRDTVLWERLMRELPAYLDAEGLAKYFPSMSSGSDVLTSYVLAVSQEAGWQIPPDAQNRMLSGLVGFVEGRFVRFSALPTADLMIRKIAAIEALSRYGQAEPRLMSSITIEPNLWPTSAVIDWVNLLERIPSIRDQARRLQEADQILRSRLNFQGTTMGFSTERSDFLWWLMVSTDTNAVRLLLTELESPAWNEDIPRLVRGALGRQRRGHWDTTVANAWGVLAMEKFSKLFEATPVTGTTEATLAGTTKSFEWQDNPKGESMSFSWPSQRSTLEVRMEGTGKPWATVQSLAAIPLREPLSSGFKITKSLTPVERSSDGGWSKGDIVRVKLELESQADMTWVVVDDPIPAGAAILGAGLGRDSRLATQGEKDEGWVWPAYEERSFESFRAYYRYVPKGRWTVEYTYRLNSEGVFLLPPTRVEALYSPEMLGEMPNGPLEAK